jgi:hypothetical protein
MTPSSQWGRLSNRLAFSGSGHPQSAPARHGHDQQRVFPEWRTTRVAGAGPADIQIKRQLAGRLTSRARPSVVRGRGVRTTL